MAGSNFASFLTKVIVLEEAALVGGRETNGLVRTWVTIEGFVSVRETEVLSICVAEAMVTIGLCKTDDVVVLTIIDWGGIKVCGGTDEGSFTSATDDGDDSETICLATADIGLDTMATALRGFCSILVSSPAFE